MAHGTPIADHRTHRTFTSATANRPWLEPVARSGYAAKGVVYMIVGFFAALAAWNAGGQTIGSKGALAQVVQEPYGQVLLGVIALGLAAYVVWRAVQSLLDPERKGTDTQGLALRAYYMVSAVVHTGLVLFALQLLFGGGGSSGDSTKSRTAELMSQPFGRWLVGLVGVAVLGGAVYQFVRAYKASFRKRLNMSELSPTIQKRLVQLGRAGLASRAVVFTMMGFFFLVAAWRAQPQEARGLSDSLRTLEQQPYGPWLLGLVAVGLIAYGIHQEVKARYRRIG